MEEKDFIETAHREYSAEIAELVHSNLAPSLIKEKLLDYHEKDIGSALELLSHDKRNKIYSILPPSMLADILEYTDDPSPYLEELSVRKRADVLSQMEPSDAVSYLETLDKKIRNALLELIPTEARKEIALLSSFDKDEIGSKMTTNYISIPTTCTIREAMNELVTQAAENDNVSTLYVTDEDEVFLGAIDLKDLIRARADTPLSDIVMTSYPYVYAEESIDDCIERIRGYSEDSIPVLDGENKLRGVLTAYELTSMVEEEISDDYAKLGGLSAEEDLREPLFRSIGKRLPWLVVLLGLGLVVSGVIGLFDSVVSKLSLIVSFQSLILGMAGNVGTQSLAVTIRSLMDERLSGKQKMFLVFKEARVGLFNGLILGSLSFILIGLYLFLIRGNAALLSFSVSLCVGIALAISMLLSGISGTAIPLILKKCGVDPAVASGPFITTVNDLVAVVTYYGLAYLLLLRLLPISL